MPPAEPVRPSPRRCRRLACAFYFILINAMAGNSNHKKSTRKRGGEGRNCSSKSSTGSKDVASFLHASTARVARVAPYSISSPAPFYLYVIFLVSCCSVGRAFPLLLTYRKLSVATTLSLSLSASLSLCRPLALFLCQCLWHAVQCAYALPSFLCAICLRRSLSLSLSPSLSPYLSLSHSRCVFASNWIQLYLRSSLPQAPVNSQLFFYFLSPANLLQL